MDSSKPTTLLRTPTPRQPALTFADANPRALRKWLDELPKANLGETARLLYQASQEINDLICPADTRLTMLESLRVEVAYVCGQLERHFLNRSVVLDERARKVANLCQALQHHLANGYKLLANQLETSKDKDASRMLGLACSRAMACLGQLHLRACQLYCPVPEGLWQDLHQLLLLGATRKLETLPVNDPLLDGLEPSLLQRYLSICLLACARPNQMRQSGMERTYMALLDWSRHVRLRQQGAEQCLFLVLPRLDAPPRYRALWRELPQTLRLGIDPSELADALREYQLLAEDKQASFRLHVPRELGPDVLQHLQQAWGAVAERSFQRKPVQQKQLELCIGMSAVHFYLGQQRGFDDILQHKVKSASFETVKDVDVWAGAFDAAPDDDWKPGFGERIEYQPKAGSSAFNQVEECPHQQPSHTLDVINQSPGGYGLQWCDDVPDQLQAGELLAANQPGQDNWNLAAVRWIRQVRGGATQMGIEMLAPKAQACGAQLLRKTEQSSQFLRALLIAPIQAISRPATLITPRLPFQEGHKVLIRREGEEYRIQLGRRLTASGSFNQFEYRRLDQPDINSQEPAGKEKSGKGAGNDFDSLWNTL
ncbi:molecular chaperone [Atopomonas sediminilitoris]|uniref:molecular chaperone n=1 Tax=Atopomonas sediminilitoris TaxID=2919919 RepID=UPI001F4EACC7|nr:molecular chaperone [Atopomonas sediminilitoris]MCJ8170265.1 molecular chaperone [Atopomonas sediminilitoris]